MSLATWQETIKKLFLSQAGQKALASQVDLTAFVAQSPLLPIEQKALLACDGERLEQYAYMLTANTQETLEVIFPITQQLLDAEWDDVVQQYVWACPPQTYQPMQVGEAFPDFLDAQDPIKHRLPFLPELALYEWTEAELLSCPNPRYPQALVNKIPQAPADYPTMAPILNQASQLYPFEHPIPQIIDFLKTRSVDNLPEMLSKPGPGTPIFIYRTPRPYKCRFFELNPFAAGWFSLVMGNGQADSPMVSYAESLQPLLAAIQHHQPGVPMDTVYAQFQGLVQHLFEEGIVLGSIPVRACQTATDGFCD